MALNFPVVAIRPCLSRLDTPMAFSLAVLLSPGLMLAALLATFLFWLVYAALGTTCAAKAPIRA
jgi:hypothetical protein